MITRFSKPQPRFTEFASRTRAEDVGGFIDATLVGPANLRVFTPQSAECRQVLAPESSVEFAMEGAGVMRRAGAECRGSGVGPLEELRRRRPDATNDGGSMIPRAQFDYRVIYEDADVTFLRGRFPLTGLLGWSGGEDTIAVVSRSASCDEAAKRGVGSVEYRPRGKKALALVAEPEPCRIEALIRPMGEGSSR